MFSALDSPKERLEKYLSDRLRDYPSVNFVLMFQDGCVTFRLSDAKTKRITHWSRLFKERNIGLDADILFAIDEEMERLLQELSETHEVMIQ